MPSLVEELQRGALDSAVDVTGLLRKAYAVATKLKLPQFKSWCEFELNGYPKGQDVPPYRISQGTLRAWNPYNGRWIPVYFPDDPETQQTLSTHRDHSPVSTTVDLLRGDGGIFHVVCPRKRNHFLCGGLMMILRTHCT